MEERIIRASDGKLLKRISDGVIVGKEIRLGYTYHIGGKARRAFIGTPEHFEEIDEPVIEFSEYIN